MDAATGVNLLLEMSDEDVRTKVGEAFQEQMQNSGVVTIGSFFPLSSPQIVKPSAEDSQWAGGPASAVIALSLGEYDKYGFNETVDVAKAQDYLNSNLAPGCAEFTSLAMKNYAALFPKYCSSGGSTFEDFLSGANGAPMAWGTSLADHMTSTAYINQQMAKLNPSVDPGSWYQIFFANIYKITCLNASAVPQVREVWNAYLDGKQQPSASNPWTVYQNMLAASYDVSTFNSQVQQAAGTESISYETLDPGGYVLKQRVTTTYGEWVNIWLKSVESFDFIVGPTDKNTSSHIIQGP